MIIGIVCGAIAFIAIIVLFKKWRDKKRYQRTAGRTARGAVEIEENGGINPYHMQNFGREIVL